MAVRDRVEHSKEMWASGAYTNATIEATALRNAEKIGEISAYKDILGMDYESYLGMHHGD